MIFKLIKKTQKIENFKFGYSYKTHLSQIAKCYKFLNNILKL